MRHFYYNNYIFEAIFGRFFPSDHRPPLPASSSSRAGPMFADTTYRTMMLLIGRGAKNLTNRKCCLIHDRRSSTWPRLGRILLDFRIKWILLDTIRQYRYTWLTVFDQISAPGRLKIGKSSPDFHQKLRLGRGTFRVGDNTRTDEIGSKFLISHWISPSYLRIVHMEL